MPLPSLQFFSSQMLVYLFNYLFIYVFILLNYYKDNGDGDDDDADDDIFLINITLINRLDKCSFILTSKISALSVIRSQKNKRTSICVCVILCVGVGAEVG